MKVERSIGRGRARTTMVVLLFVVALLFPVIALGASRLHAATLVPSTFEVNAEKRREAPPTDIPPDQEQPEESGKSPAGGSTIVVEEEEKANHTALDLCGLVAGLLQGATRVDHAYEAWFYTVTHPPLTPPPNAA